MQHLEKHILQFLAFSLMFVSGVTSSAGAPAATRTAIAISFGGIEYLHRWSKEGQNEFTPSAEADLNAWHDMVTIDTYASVQDGERLADVANNVVARYQKLGKILRTSSVPRTERSPAQHFIAAVLAQPTFLEAVFARLMLVEGNGYAIVVSHRVYGSAAGPAMSEWLEANGPQMESRLMGWDGIPSLDKLKSLPQN